MLFLSRDGRFSFKTKSMRFFYLILINILFFSAKAQGPYAPPAGQPGTTAIYKDSSAFVAWATNCVVTRGWQNIADTTLGKTSVGTDADGTQKAGTNGVVSLGDGGFAILTFAGEIFNGPGYDFAVFENSFSDDFLELAFVEVSSDGVNFFRFPAHSLTQDTVQVDGFGTLDATNIHNLAGKYRAMYGTPFDLEDLNGIAGLDINHITHVKIIDVVGSIDSLYATYDSYGNKVNDPFPTPFASGGFDLDAVGVINFVPNSINEVTQKNIQLINSAATSKLFFSVKNNKNYSAFIANINGQIIQDNISINHDNNLIEIQNLPQGMYFITLRNQNENTTFKFLKL